MSKNQLVLITGANGYLGAHIVDRLVRDGYRVRGTVRSAKLASSKKGFAIYGDAVEIVVVDDLVKDVVPHIFEGVDALIHTAQPLPGRATAEESLNVSIEGSLNIIKQAEKAGIKRFSYASSFVAHSIAFFQGDTSKLTEDQWFPIPRDTVLKEYQDNIVVIYSAQKAISEQAVWKFAEQHPHIEMTSISATFFYGPFAPGHRGPFEGDTFSPSILGTMELFYGLLHPNGELPPLYWIDVRDAARAFIEALNTPPTSQVGRKRILVSSEYHPASEIAELIAKERPQLAHRISKNVKTAPEMKQIVFNDRFNEIMHFELVPWKKTILDAVDALVKLEGYWKEKGKPIYSD